ncbi:hypothetical protein CHS0354_000736 [Potamilus streckersoni]|uniref:Tetratricopeptide repeat protein n=1 Tax=Potamilus streckersoni TaxID=2493646 RepID=A0AAE0W9D6_9BIVA|nr:hypothetical protein CHS0354_000736 [Potamilus streckersoni]
MKGQKAGDEKESTKEHLLKEAESLWLSMKTKDATVILNKLNLEYPNDYEVLCAMSHAHVLLGQAGADDIKETEFREAERYATKAISINPNRSLGYLRRASASGLLAQRIGIFEVSPAVNRTAEDLRKAITLNTDGNKVIAMAHFILAKTHHGLSKVAGILRFPIGLGWGNIDDALKHFQYAIDLDQNYVLAKFEYAKAMYEYGKVEAAKDMLKSIQKIRSPDLRDEKYKIEAKRFLEQISN